MLDNATKITISRPIRKSITPPKLSGRKIDIKSIPHFQFETRRDNKVFHENIALTALPSYFNDKMAEYKQADIWHENGEHTVVYNNKGVLKAHKLKNKVQPQTITSSHDNEKNYILKEGDNIPILCELGIFNQNFRVIKGAYSKFKQINNFLEIIDTAAADTDLGDGLRIVDFGCGSSYLTFVVYHYFTQIKKVPVHITGVDLKPDLIARCAELAGKYGYTDMHFACADIQEYTPEISPDMVISLHGCNTATDYAICNGIKWGAKFMFVAPCCQHEINSQMKRDALGELYAPLKYGILKDRFAALLTDGLRANILETFDYKTDMVEFVGFNHSPKNILIRARKSAHDAQYKQTLREQINKLIIEFNINPTLYKLVNTITQPNSM
ncbi:MAG: SAM-dependent methyltransferase [Defluviitaleaceae bacterium]|nr:SAM-dependent methyltransferase [Defluviitaleaceae bacterium]